MKHMEMAIESCKKIEQVRPPTPPPLPPLPRFWAATKPAFSTSVTNQEIARFWRQKRLEEEDHLLAAIKAAAHIRARNLTEEDYRHFEESLKDTDENHMDGTATTDKHSNKDETKELRVGIKDWWTKSKYAYLNQPAVESTDSPRKRTSAYIPNFCFYMPAAPQPTSLGVF